MVFNLPPLVNTVSWQILTRDLQALYNDRNLSIKAVVSGNGLTKSTTIRSWKKRGHTRIC